MTFVVELRDLKKNLPRPVGYFWRRSAESLCALRVRLAFFGLLGFAIDHAFDARIAHEGGVLASLCGVLSAAVSATLGLLGDFGVGVYALFSDDASPVLRLGQGLSLCFEEQVSPFDVCAAAAPFPAFSWHFGVALMLFSPLLFGCGFRGQQSPKLGRER